MLEQGSFNRQTLFRGKITVEPVISQRHIKCQRAVTTTYFLSPMGIVQDGMNPFPGAFQVGRFSGDQVSESDPRKPVSDLDHLIVVARISLRLFSGNFIGHAKESGQERDPSRVVLFFLDGFDSRCVRKSENWPSFAMSIDVAFAESMVEPPPTATIVS